MTRCLVGLPSQTFFMEYSNNLRKLVKSLDEVRHRRETGLFKIEGTKCVTDTVGRFEMEYLLATPEWIESNPDSGLRPLAVAAREMTRMSSMVTPPGVISICRIPSRTFDPSMVENNLVLALDAIRDPGNLGTIIRVADWFGINDILCSTDTVDCWGPKVVQATMGSIARVRLHYLDLPATLSSLKCEIFGTFLDGADIYNEPLSSAGVIVIGNESHGVSDSVASLVTRRLTIPSFPVGAETGESLNAAVATAVTVSTFRQKQWQNK